MRLVYQAGTQCRHALCDVARVAKLASIGGTVSQRCANELGKSAAQAEAYIRSGIAVLTADEFVATQTQNYASGAVEADIYGVTNDDGEWFVKFYVENGRVTVTSWHGPTDELVRADGKCLKP
jgi:hypothetical protein